MTATTFIPPVFTSGSSPVAVNAGPKRMGRLSAMSGLPTGTSSLREQACGLEVMDLSEPVWLRTFTANAKRIADLQPGWDGRGSVAISSLVLYNATRITRLALEGLFDVTAPYIVPGGDGSVQIEWHERFGELELDVHTDGRLSIWGRDHRTGAEFEGDDEKAVALFYRWAPWLASNASNGNDAPLPPDGAIFKIAA